MIFESQIEYSRNRVLHITGRAEIPSDDLFVRLLEQFCEGMTQQGAFLGLYVFEESVLQGLSLEQFQENADEESACGFHFGAGMSQGQMLKCSLTSSLGLVGVKGNNRRETDQAADVLFRCSALTGRVPGCIIVEEIAVAFLYIGVPVAVRCRHESNVSLQKVIGLISLVLIQGVDQQSTDFDIEGVFAGFQKLMVMDTFLTPVLGLFVKDFSFGIDCCIAGPPKNAVWVGVVRCQVVFHPAVVLSQSVSIVIPVDRHGQGIAYAEAI